MSDTIMNEETHARIAQRAYEIAESHGFTPGKETEFWRQAEAELLNGSHAAPTNETAIVAVPTTETAIVEVPTTETAIIEVIAPTEIIAIAKPRTRAPRTKTAAGAETDGTSGIEIITPEGEAITDKPKRASQSPKSNTA